MESENWLKLEGQAQWLLAHADQAPPTDCLRGMGMQLRLWQYPRSGAHLSWALIVPVRDYRQRRAIIREASWERSSDWKGMMTPMKTLKRRAEIAPSVQIRDAEVDWAELAPFLDDAARLPMKALGTDPALPSEEGVAGLEGFRSLAHVRLEWAGKGPREWTATIRWFEKLRRMLVRIMGERDSAAPSGA
jgi:hypothetical protein